MKKSTGYFAAKPGVSVGGVFALLAGTGLLVASALGSNAAQTSKALKASAQPYQPVKLNMGAWSYLSNLQLGTDRALFADVVELGLDEQTFPTEAAHLRFDKPLVVRRKAIRHRKPAVTPIIAQSDDASIVPVSVTVTTHGHVVASQASPSGDATEAQLEAFRNMHRQLRGQFFLAMTPAGAQQLAAMTTQQDLAQVQVAEVASVSPETEEVIAALKAVAAEKAAKKFEAPAKSVDDSEAKSAEAVQDASYNDTIHERAAEPAQVRANAKVGAAVANLVADYSAFQHRTEGTYKQLAEITSTLQPVQTGVTPQVVAQQSASSDKSSGAAVSSAQFLTQEGAALTPGKVSGSAGYSHQAEYSTLDLIKMWNSWKAQHQAAAAKVTIQAVPQTQAAQAPAPAAPRLPTLAEVAALKTTHDDVIRDDADHGYVAPAPQFVEAFRWNTEVEGASAKAVTLEGWNEVQAADHWSVIHWNPDGDASAPLISHNTAVMLAHFADTELQQDAAIVFGKIPAGWEVEYSDRAEKVIYLDDQNKTDAPSDNPRYFAFINAAPGSQVVTLKATLGAETASVVAPVLNGSSTYLDMTSVSKRVFSGSVLDAGSQARNGIAGATVQVVGQPNAVFFTTDSGYFHLSEVFAVGDYPIYAETSTVAGFKHRYRINPGRMDGIDLFRMPEDQIRTWISQLEGGVSPESGLIVAAMPGLTKTYGDGRLFATTRTLLSNSTLTPETYTLSNDGELNLGAPLEATSSRYVSVQVPNGPIVSQVEDNNRNVIWSQLVFAQPGVINVVGPF